MKSKARKGTGNNMGKSECSVKRKQVEWMALHAFREVLGRRQSRYPGVLVWIKESLAILKSREGEMCVKMEGVVRTVPAVE